MIFPAAILASIILHGLIYGSCRWLKESGLPLPGLSLRPAPDTVMEVGMVEVSPSRPAVEPPQPEERLLQKKQTEILASQDRSRSIIPAPLKAEPVSAPARPAPAPDAPGRAGSDLRSLGAAREEYWDRVRRRIEKAMYYPRRARLARLEGTVRVGFTIGDEGEIVRSRIIEPSSHPLFNRAAREIIKRAAPFPPPLKEIRGMELSVPITFESTL